MQYLGINVKLIIMYIVQNIVIYKEVQDSVHFSVQYIKEEAVKVLFIKF